MVTNAGYKPRRTAERILKVTLELFNRFGEPSVSTTPIPAEPGIHPGHLYYHDHAKDELINSLFDRHEKALDDVLRAADGVENAEYPWLFFHMLFELNWQYRFLPRDLNDLLPNSRRPKTHFQFVLRNNGKVVADVLNGLARGNAMQIDMRDAQPASSAMVVALTYWLSFGYVGDPRRALAPVSTGAALLRGAHHVLSLLWPYLVTDQREHLRAPAAHYQAR